MIDYDVLIVGGGPAGSSCARALTEGGLAVGLIDQAVFPRDKTCAGWITPAVVQALGLDLADYAGRHTLQPIRRFRLGLERLASEARFARPVSYGIRRCEFDDYLLRRSGAALHLGEPAKSIAAGRAGWCVNGRYRAPLLIGAGGHFCPVARTLGADPGRGEPAIAAQEFEFELDAAQQAACAVAPDAPELYFSADLGGYAWCVRKGDWLNVGLGHEDHRQLGARLQRFIAARQAERRLPDRLPERAHGHAYLLYPQAARPLVRDGALLIGDAAGLAYARSGEGIRPAIESGLLAAQTVLAARGDYRLERLAAYAAAVTARYGARARPPSAAPSSLKRALARRLLGNAWFAREVVLRRWFLHEGERAVAR